MEKNVFLKPINQIIVMGNKVIKFYATWCGPCKIYGKTWDKVKAENTTDTEFIDVDIDKDTTGLAAEYKIDSVPTTVYIGNDGETTTKVGRLSKEDLITLINQ